MGVATTVLERLPVANASRFVAERMLDFLMSVLHFFHMEYVHSLSNCPKGESYHVIKYKYDDRRRDKNTCKGGVLRNINDW